LSEETKARMREAHIKKKGRPRLEGDAQWRGKVGLRGKGEHKVLHKPRRLHFPSRPAGVTEGAFRVEKFRYFCETYLQHISGEWNNRPFILDVWQLELATKLLGTLNEDGLRQYRKCLLHIGRRNGKSTFASALALYWLAEESWRDPGGEIYILSTDEKQARIIFRICRLMVIKNKYLRSLLQIRQSPANISNSLTHSLLEVLSSKVESKAGRNASLVLIDETKSMPSRELYDVMETSMGSRREPLLVSLSTAGENEGSFYFELYTYAKKVRLDQNFDSTFLPVIYEVDREADPFDEAVWPLANPALDGGYRSLEEMRSYAQKAKNDPSWLGTFSREYLNIWTSYTSQSWLSPGEWDGCFSDESNIPADKSRKVWLGLDTSGSQDLTALVVLAEPLEAGGRWDVEAEIWVPGVDLLKKSRADHLAYDVWYSKGLINFNGQPTIDMDDLKYVVIRCFNTFNVQAMGFDPYRMKKFIADLIEFGMPQDKLVPVSQNAKTMSAAIDSIQAKIVNRTLRHNGNPVLKAMSDNVRLVIDHNGNRMLDKGKSASKIDGIAALCIAEATILLKRDRG
jgi:phage terminase large subunit-like protein